MIIFSDAETPIDYFFKWIAEKAINEMENTEESSDKENM